MCFRETTTWELFAETARNATKRWQRKFFKLGLIFLDQKENLSFSKSLYINKQRSKTLEANFSFTQKGFMFQDLARVICLIDVRFDKAASDWITLQEEFPPVNLARCKG